MEVVCLLKCVSIYAIIAGRGTFSANQCGLKLTSDPATAPCPPCSESNVALVVRAPNATAYVHPYYCKCKPGWVGDDCSTRTDSLLGWFLSRGKLAFPPCCGVCPAQYDTPAEWSTVAGELNAYSTDRCDRFGWFQRWDMDHGYKPARGPEPKSELEKQCFDRFNMRHRAFYRRPGLRTTPWLDLGSAARERLGVPILSYDGYDSFLELATRGLADAHPTWRGLNLSLIALSHTPASAHWVHAMKPGVPILHNAPRVNVAAREHPRLWRHLMLRFRETLERRAGAGRGFGLSFMKQPPDFPCCVYCAPNATETAEATDNAGYDKETHHKIRRKRGPWWKAPQILPSNFARNRSRGGCCEVCPGVVVGPHHYNLSSQADIDNDLLYNASHPYPSLLEEDPTVFLEGSPNRKVDFNTDWDDWDERNPHLQRRRMRQTRRVGSFPKPKPPLPPDVRWRRAYRQSPCLQAERFQLRASKDQCHVRGSCCNICPSQFWLQTRTSVPDGPFEAERVYKHDEAGAYLWRADSRTAPRPVSKSATARS